MKEFKTSKGEFLAELLPDDSINYSISYTIPCTLNLWFKEIDNESVELPKGNYEIIGLLSEITEEQAKDVVHLQTARFNLFKNYTGHDGMFRTALESFNSLMQANEIYSENPLGKNKPLHVFSDHHNESESPMYQKFYGEWQQAQENTGNWLILKK